MPGPSWLWRGRSGGWRRVLAAAALAPLLGPALLCAFEAVSASGAPRGIYPALFLVGAAISYGVTVVYGLPLYLLLSRFNLAGALPLALAGALPGPALFARGQQTTLIQLLIAAGVLIAVSAWAIATEKRRG